MPETEIDFEKFIEDVALRLPDLPPGKRKNLYDILGIQRKETLNSKVLRYFFDANEEHGLGTLFIDALKNVLKEKSSDLVDTLNGVEGNFKVIIEDLTINAEDETKRQKRIDILIEGSDWCIIIENKLYHTVDNPLKIYWEHAHKKYPNNKIGIILSLFPVASENCKVDENIKYINILHNELITEVQKIFLLTENSNYTDVFYLTEYFKTIKSHYQQKMDKIKMNKTVHALISQREHIKKIEKSKSEAITFISDEIDNIFAERGFDKNDYNHYYHPNFSKLIFVVNCEDIINNNRLWLSFEIWNTGKSEIKELIESFNKFRSENEPLSYGNGQINKIEKIQLCIFDETDFLNDQTNFSEKFAGILDKIFFKVNGIIMLTEDFFKIDKMKIKTRF